MKRFFDRFNKLMAELDQEFARVATELGEVTASGVTVRTANGDVEIEGTLRNLTVNGKKVRFVKPA
jgi:acyl dehydratase